MGKISYPQVRVNNKKETASNTALPPLTQSALSTTLLPVYRIFPETVLTSEKTLRHLESLRLPGTRAGCTLMEEL